MAESEKTAAAGKSKEKTSLLDIDIDKDFLGSWKSMSMGDDGMDFDFGPPAQGKKKTFNFDKMDMDFSFDGDFGKLPSFKMDMPGLDISSPSMKSGNLKDKSKEVSSGGENRSKRESFQFSFDFDEFADLDFGSKKKKTDEKSNMRKDKEALLDATTSGGSEEPVAKDVVASVGDDISSKHSVSQDVSISKVAQMDKIRDIDPRNEDDHLKSVLDENCHQNPVNAKELDIQREYSPEKIMSCSLQDPVQESQSSDKRSSPEPHAQKVTQDWCGQSSTDNVSTEAAFSDMQEEESRTMVEVVSLNKGDEKKGYVMPMPELAHSRNLSEHVKSQSESEMCEKRDDNVFVGHVHGDDTSKADSRFESSITPGIGNLAPGEVVDNKNADSSFKFHLDSQDGGTTFDELASEKKRVNVPVLSKYFNKQNGSQSDLQKMPVSSTKLIPIGNKRVSTLSSTPAVEKRELGSRSVDTGTKLTGISRSLPNVPSRDIPVQAESTETAHVKSLDKSRECLKTDIIKPTNEPVRTIVSHNIGQRKEEPVSKGSDHNTEDTNAFRSAVHPSISIEQTNKIQSQNSSNPGLQVTSMASIPNMRKLVEKKMISSTNAEIKRVSEVSTPRISRVAEPMLKTLNSMLGKGLTSTRSKEIDKGLQGNVVLKGNPSANIKKQSPSTPSLKRKTFEGSAEITKLTPLKRLSVSPGSNTTRTSSERVIDKQVYKHSNMANEKSPRLDISHMEVDISSEIENDDIFEKAEACSKELEDICNMLKKKHEEAKDILVRAIVNNNNLLMLNHPIYQDKINMVQKFAAGLMLK
uniref:uncharacterized protein At4g18490 n=1 Tax=Erigeron canadensis TaxID=72917 RepID=UPI001CB973EC|nr:uncharacterized protein At4g18490 [Erigeron canadensis]